MDRTQLVLYLPGPTGLADGAEGLGAFGGPAHVVAGCGRAVLGPGRPSGTGATRLGNTGRAEQVGSDVSEPPADPGRGEAFGPGRPRPSGWDTPRGRLPRLTTRQFRRTLAWFIARRPGGTIAGALQYRHQYVQMFEGYAGTSDSGFRDEVESTPSSGGHGEVTVSVIRVNFGATGWFVCIRLPRTCIPFQGRLKFATLGVAA